MIAPLPPPRIPQHAPPDWLQPGAMALTRAADLEVIATVIANLTADGRDRSLDDKRGGMGFAPGSRASMVIEELSPGADGTDAANRGYRVVCLTEACQAQTAERHAQALTCLQAVAELLTVESFAAALRRAGVEP